MTFEELLAENQRLRERVYALEQENALLKAQRGSVLWFGSIELAGSRHREDDNVMRINASIIASEMMGYILGDSDNV